MKKAKFLAQLRQALSHVEWEALEQNIRLPISVFNREILLEMKDKPAVGDDEISIEQASGLYETLGVYLAEYMADQPEGWKYIILASLYLTFVAKRPMHPIDLLGISVTETADITIYECPQKSTLPKTACSYCVCKKKQS